MQYNVHSFYYMAKDTHQQPYQTVFSAVLKSKIKTTHLHCT